MASSADPPPSGAAPAGRSGPDPHPAAAPWRLHARPRQLDARLSRLAGGAPPAVFDEPELDTLVCVTAGHAVLEAGGERHEVGPDAPGWVPHGTAALLHPGPGGVAYCAVQRRRPLRGGTDDDGAACLLDRVCPDCGRLADSRDALFCPRCGHALERD
ncbi:hypothetical protein [Nocardiopsis coralliicola]